LAEIEDRIGRGFCIEPEFSRAYKTGLWKKGPVVVSPSPFGHIGKPGHIIFFISAYTLFTGPEGKGLTPEVEITELFPAAIDMFINLS